MLNGFICQNQVYTVERENCNLCAAYAQMSFLGCPRSSQSTEMFLLFFFFIILIVLSTNCVSALFFVHLQLLTVIDISIPKERKEKEERSL